MKYEYETFEDWFNEAEGYSYRSDRFFTSVHQFTSVAGENANLELWLRAAFDSARILSSE